MRFYILLITLVFSAALTAHEEHQDTNKYPIATATYLGNEAVMVASGEAKIVFDPFFHQGFDFYQLVPETILVDMFENKAPYNDINAIFISHAHGDHFAADQVLKYLKKFPKTQLFAPRQAIDEIKLLPGHESILSQTTAIQLAYGDAVKTINSNGLNISVVRIPHSGWPTRRLDVSNLVFRVTLPDGTTVMHMGDADPNDVHFKPHDKHWQSQLTDTAFPPYWFFYSTYGPDILADRINATESVGVHVPIKTPKELIDSGQPFFSKPGETRIVTSKEHQ